MAKMLLQAAVNGELTKADHGAVPVTARELASDVPECIAAGARAFHVHPRDADGRESLEPADVDAVVSAMRAAGAPSVGVTTGEWIQPDLQRRLVLVRGWKLPDYTSVNLSEPGAVEVAHALLDIGIGIEAGLGSVEDAELLLRSGLSTRLTRLLIEPADISRADAVPTVSAIHEVLNRAGVEVPRLQHGNGAATWILIEDAIRRGVDTRVGLEDTSELPDGRSASGNADLIRAAYQMGAGRDVS